jgi:tRNA C32,U32 (ribose-2'-O)-methylase TrmJ
MFRLPVMKAQTQELLAQLRTRQIRGLALVAPHGGDHSLPGNGSSPRAPKRLQDTDLTTGCVLFVGNEGSGLPRDLLRDVQEFVTIPQTSVESLNAGVAASIALYEAKRQRSAGK